MTLRFYYDVVCPYAYIASTRVEAVARAAGAQVEWCPVLLGGVFRTLGSADDPNATLPAAKAALGRLDILRQAAHHRVPLSIPPEHPRRTVDAMRLILAAPAARRPAVSRALFRTYWVEGRDISDRAVLSALALDSGVAADAYLDPVARQALFDNTAALVAAGGFGVPSFQVGDSIWWGQDRLDFAAEALRAGPERAPLIFYHDFSSPFSYLGSTQVERIARAAGRRVERVPMLLGALFKQIGTPLVPLQGFSQPKQRWVLRDMADWAARWGVDFVFPSRFPMNTVAALRVAIQEPSVTPALYRAAWVEDLDIGDSQVLTGVLDRAGFDGAALLAGTTDPQIKAALRANTDRARDAGVCGAPTFEVDGALFWGQDRLDLVAAALAR